MPSVTEGVEFDTVAREWRCKWNPENGKQSLKEAQELLETVLVDLKKLDGHKSTQRIVCGGCMDFKVITALSANKYGDWEEKKFAPEETFLAKLKSIDGVTEVETQTYTLMTM